MKTKNGSFPLFLTIGWIMVTLWSAPSLQAATNIKVSGVMPPFGDVTEFQISPNGRYAVYLADQDTDGVFELYSVLLGDGATVRLNPILPSGRNVATFQISPDSSRVVYRADQETDNVYELYSVPLGGPAAAGVKLNVTQVVGDVISFLISPDSSRVVYSADQETVNIFELYSVPLGGPAAAGVKLNVTLVAGDVIGYLISPDSSRVVYSADQETNTVFELYSVPLGGPATAGVKLNGTLVAGGNVSNFQISPDSSRVVYVADQETATVSELYSVPLGGPAATGIKLNGALVTGGNVSSFRISPDSGRVVYFANQQTATVSELYSVPLGGPAATGIKLNGALVTGGNVSSFRISPDSGRVVYLADQQTDNVYELYSVPLLGPAAAGVKLNVTQVVGDVISFSISPDSSRVVYSADQETVNIFELYSVPLGGPAAAGVKLNVTLVAGDVIGYLISPDSSRVVYSADQETNTVFELYSVPLGGPAIAGVKLNGTLVAGGNVSNFQISPDSGRVVYLADQDTDEVIELYMTSNYLLHLPLILRQG
jgi:Tol biopolymer transport system component